MQLPRHALRVRTIVLIVLAVVVLIIGGIALHAWSALSKVAAGGGVTEPFDGRYNIAVLGSDSADWRDGARVDSATIVSVDAVTGRTLMVSVPRNLTLVPFPSDSPLHDVYPNGYVCPNQASEPCMLTMVYQTGLDHADLYPDVGDPGAQATVEALEGITGLSVNYYAFVDMDGFVALVNAVGGIDMDIRTRVAIGAVGQTLYWIEPGQHHFTGDEALWYVRSRVGTDDYARMVRQKCVMLAVVAQVDAQTVATRFLALTDAAAGTARTNVPVSQVPTLVGLGQKAMTWTVEGLNLTPPRVDPLRPDYPAIRSLVAEAIAQVEAMDDPTSVDVSSVPITDLTTTCGA